MIKIICDECNEEEEYITHTCDDCFEKGENKNVLEAVEEVFKNPIWTDKEHFIGFNSKEEKEAYLRGVKFGYEHSLFWICDYFHLIEEFEKLAGWKND